ncbi:MAG TPA: amidohydrolase [Firmicutes bacterium]|nr:amidohydrolase [Candidatus Fermentithermobacillaceae bacterium]
MNAKATVYQNGSFYVLPNETRKREALAAYEGRVIYVGDRDAAKDAFPAGVTPEVVDLGGKTVLPGFIDSHMHLMSLGLGLRNLSLSDVRSIVELKAIVKAAAESTREGEWILGRGWDQDFMREKRYPNRRDLDEASGDKPVCLTRACGHLVVLNSKALEICGITRDTPDPEGGAIDRDQYGDPTGVLRETAQELAWAHIPEPGPEALLEATKKAMEYLLARGITSVHTNDGYGGYSTVVETYKKAHSENMPLRVYWDLPVSYLDDLVATPLRTGDGDDYFRIGAVKMFADGSLGGRTAALEEPYNDDPSTSGILVNSEAALKEWVYRAHCLGMQVAVHAIGDRAARVSLEAISEAQSRLPRSPLRHRIVHAQILSPHLISEMKRLGVVADVQPKFITTDLRWAEDRVGYRMRCSYAWKTMLRAGIPLAGGSDSPVEPPDPMWGIYAAVTRKDMDGNPRGGYYPNERISVSDAVHMFTMGAAFAAFEEDVKGTLEPGKLADFVVLSHDPFAISSDRLKDVEVLMTVVGGEIAYQKA